MNVDVKQDGKGIWYARPYLGTAPDGTTVRPYKRFPEAATRAQAQELANAWVEKLTGKAAIADLLEEYIADGAAKGKSVNTISQWNSFRKAYVGKYLKGAPASELTAKDLNDFERRLLMPKDAGGRGLSRATVRLVHYFLQGAYRHWVAIGLCPSNPMLSVNKPAREKHEAVAVDEWDYPALAKAIDAAMGADEQTLQASLNAAYAFAAWLSLHTGMRLGEVCAMRRRDVRARQGYLHVCGTVVELPGGGIERKDETKSRKSRNVAVTQGELETIAAFMRKQDSTSGEFRPDSPLVSADGSFMRPSTVSKAFSRTRDRLGLSKGCTFHSLRHTHATWLLANGANLKDIADRLGHANESITLQNYAHAMPGRDAAAAETFDRVASELGRGCANGMPTE